MRALSLALVATTLAWCSGCQRIPGDPFVIDDAGEDDTATGEDDGEETATTTGGGSNVPTYNCDPNDEEACPEGEKCTPLEMGGKQNVYDCVEDTLEHGLFEDCEPAPKTGKDGCPAGSVCLGEDFDSENGLCLPMCKSGGDCELALCIGHVFTKVQHCSDHCDPLLPMCGNPKLDCLHTEDRFTCKYATEEDDGSYGEPCDGISDRGCAQGAVCLQGEVVPGCAAGFCCTTVCDLDEPDPCTSPATCNPLEMAAPPGFEHIGACYVPF